MVKLIDEAVDEIFDSVQPEQINLKSFETKEKLNDKVWEDGSLKQEIRKRLLSIAKAFVDTIKIPELPIVDIILVGSSASYNWSKYSDLDLHILVDFTKIDVISDVDLLKDYFTCKKNEWNNKHSELSVASYPVELYVQDMNEENASDGVYSIKNDYWIKQPHAKNIEMNKTMIKQQAAALVNRIEQIQDIFDNCKSRKKLTLLTMVADKLYDTIVQGRRDGLAAKGEGSNENIVFKVLRRTGHLGMLRELKSKAYDKLESL